ATAAVAVLLGWFNGPFLAAIGLIGAAAAPFVVGGQSEAPYWLYAYFPLVAAIGLAVDAVRRWAWISVLALVLGYLGLGAVLAGPGGAGWAALAVAALPLLATAMPALRLTPDHAGPTVTEALWMRGRSGWPIFPTRIAAGALAVTAVALVLLPAVNADEAFLAFLCLAVLAVAYVLWTDRSPGLADLAILPAVGFVPRLIAEGLGTGPLVRDYLSAAIEFRPPETPAPMTASWLLLMAVLVSLAAAWRSLSDDRHKPAWALGAALAAPVSAVALELFWQPARVAGAYPWALQVIALAALMVAVALRFARADGEDRRRAAYATLSALSLIALALFLVTTKGALTLALAALVAVASALDRRWRLPEMALFVQAGVVTLSW